MLQTLTSKSHQDLWNEDLDEFMAHWEASLEEYAALNNRRPAAKKGKRAAKISLGDSDDDFEASSSKGNPHFPPWRPHTLCSQESTCEP